jgi:hypothetical protein
MFFRSTKEIDTDCVRTYPVHMNLTLSINDEVIAEARRRAEAMGTSVNQLVRDYLTLLAGKSNADEIAVELEQLSQTLGGDRRDWRFDREELHERR